MVLFIVFGHTTYLAQDIQLLTEDFETGGGSVSINNGGPGSNSGNNLWLVNNNYVGAPTYPNTTTQDNTVSGTIGFAPTSNYLHIHNQPSGITNNNYSPQAVSDQFAYTQYGLCTYGLSDIHFSFFWLCEGSATAYGTVYYSADGGAWVPIGLPQYSGSALWQYEDITDPAFEDVGSLRFGFRWQNDNSSDSPTQSFSIDDINIVATFGAADPVTITVTSVSPDPVCEGSFLTINYSLSDTLCDGNYSIELSNGNGQFNGQFGSWVTSIYYPNTSGSLTIQLPANAGADDCYKIRINRMSPDPQITGVASPCFEIIECPNVITTMAPVVASDPFPVCVQSAIDIPFTSTGIYEANSSYICQLSEPDGTFSANPPVVGSSQDNATYDPALGQQPGSVSGLIPETADGCNYYLRIVSTNPNAIGSVWGPFCIQHCDITTNDTENLSFCIHSCAVDPNGETQLIDIDINSYDNAATYLPGNEFTTQLLSMQDFSQIGPLGVLGSVTAVSSTQLAIHIPCIDSLLDLGIPIGTNYLRIVATNSTTPQNVLGTLIHISIGIFVDDPPVISPYTYPSFAVQDTFCVNETLELFFDTYDPTLESTFEWQSNGINGGQPFVSPSGEESNNLYVNLGAPGNLTFSIQQTNNGCVSDWTPAMSVTVLGDPIVNITGPSNVCEGDTNMFQVNFTPNTYYSWSTTAPGTSIAYQDTSNNVLNIAFSQTGNFTLNLNVLNQCGSDDDSHLVHVLPYPIIAAGPDTLICIGDDTEMSVTTGGGYTYSWSDGATVLGTTSNLSVTPPETTSYIAAVTAIGGCVSHDTVLVEVQFPDPPTIIPDSICNGGNSIELGASYAGVYTWQDGSHDSTFVVTTPGSYDLSIDIAGELCPYLEQFDVVLTQPWEIDHVIDSICPGGENTIVLAADEVGTYVWFDGIETSTHPVTDTGSYQVQILQPDDFCPRILQYDVEPMLPEPAEMLIDSVCPNGDNYIILSADDSGLYDWSTGVSSSSISVSDTGFYSVSIYPFVGRCPRILNFTVIPDTCIAELDPNYWEELFVYLPNAFSPVMSKDINDVFGPVFSNSKIVVDYQLIIIDRWGSPVFISHDPEEKWQGEFMGGEYFVKDDVYVWQLEYRNKYETEGHKLRGHVTIIR